MLFSFIAIQRADRMPFVFKLVYWVAISGVDTRPAQITWHDHCGYIIIRQHHFETFLQLKIYLILNDFLLLDDKFLKRKIRHLSKTPIHHVSDALRLVAIYRWFIFALPKKNNWTSYSDRDSPFTLCLTSKTEKKSL